MKKFISIFIILALSLSLVACDSASGESSVSETSKTESNMTESSAESSAEPTPAPEGTPAPEPSEQPDTSTLPAVGGSDEFVSAFTGNEIDTAYLNDFTLASTITSMVNITTNTTTVWERDLNFAYNKLMSLLSGDEKTSAELEQSAWNNDLPIVIKEIQNKESENGSSGKLDAAYEIMIVYRSRAAELHAKIFDLTGELEFAPEEGQVAG